MLLTDSVNQECGQQTWFASLPMTYQKDSNVRGLESYECYFTQLSEAGRGYTMSGSDETVKQSVHMCLYSLSFSKHIKQSRSCMDSTTYLHPTITQFSTLPQVFFFLLSYYHHKQVIVSYCYILKVDQEILYSMHAYTFDMFKEKSYSNM